MKKNWKILITGCLMLSVVAIGMGAGLYVPNADGDDLGRSDKKFGTAHVTSVKASGTSTSLSVVVQNSLTVGTNATVGGVFTVSGVSTGLSYTALNSITANTNITAAAYFVGTTATGQTYSVTNILSGYTNVLTFTKGLLSGVAWTDDVKP